MPQNDLIGRDATIDQLRRDIERAARTSATVLITGETGVGKDAVGRTIHELSDRRAKPYVTVNCAGVADSLLESEFFGHVQGSFTGAYRDNPGMLRRAHTGTVFLDEVGEMSVRLQALLLRFLENGEIQPVGGATVAVHVDVRVIAATNRQLGHEAAQGRFRSDLFYRLNVLDLRVPPLRHRAGDVPLLAEHFLRTLAARHGRPELTLSPAALDHLMARAWPGNIRELKNLLERVVVRTDEPIIEVAHLSASTDLVPAGEPQTASATAVPPHLQAALDKLFQRHESFWTAVHAPFMNRDLTRDDLRLIVRTGLTRTQGNYRALMSLFNLQDHDYKRCLGFLTQHDCHLSIHHFRPAKASLHPPVAATPRAGASPLR